MKAHQMFSVHTTPEEFQGNHITTSLSKTSVFQQNVFRPAGIFKFVRFEELRLRDGLVWTVGQLNRRNKTAL